MKYKKNIIRILKKGGYSLIYSALLLYYAFRRKDIPRWAKSIVIGSLGYLLSPIDSIPDLTPLLGYTDDLGILSYALVLIAAYINDEVREKAKARFHKLVRTPVSEQAIKSVENFL